VFRISTCGASLQKFPIIRFRPAAEERETSVRRGSGGIRKTGRVSKVRRVDIIGRSIPMQATETSMESVQRYLRQGLTESARLLAERPVIVAWPEKDLGRIIWPTV
jgi:hypothetical protein